MKPAVRVDTAAMQAKFQKAMVSQGQQQVQDKVRTGVKRLLDNLQKKKEAPKQPPPAPPDTTRG